MIAWRDLERPGLQPVERLLSRWREGADPAVQTCARRVSQVLRVDRHGRSGIGDGQSIETGPQPWPPLLLLEATALRDALLAVAGSALEQGGLLVGQPYGFDADSGRAGVAAVHIRGAIASGDSQASAVSLRMPAAVWTAAHARLGPGERVVGWFHSHPGIGAFFSDTDRQTQAAFFREDYSLGWVIDPVLHEQAWFAGAAAHRLKADQVWVVQRFQQEPT